MELDFPKSFRVIGPQRCGWELLMHWMVYFPKSFFFSTIHHYIGDGINTRVTSLVESFFFFFFNFMMFMLLWIIVYKVYWIRFFPSWLVVFHDHPLTCELLRIGNKKKRFMRECKDGAKIKQLGGNYKTYKHYIL